MNRQIRRIYIHTAAAGRGNKPIDQSAATIKSYHVNSRNFSDIGYHKVIRFNGDIELGRSVEKIGAGVSGDNTHTLHICVTGHGDLADFTDKQYVSLVNLLTTWLKTYGLEKDFLDGKPVILGHAEYWKYIKPGPALKSCPGKKVDMDKVRDLVRNKLVKPKKELTILVNGKEAEGFLEKGIVYVNISKLTSDLGGKKKYDKDTHTSTYDF